MIELSAPSHRQTDGQTCFLPDQYAITWAWNGSGDVMSFDPITQQWTDYGKTTLPDGTVVGGFSMDINNNTNNPLVVYQVGGKLYTAPLDDPTSLSEVGPANNPQFGNSYPCGAFRPGTEEYWVGIGSGSSVGIADLNTGAITTLGSLKDNRDGANLQAGPGDWFFDPEGNLFLMARDTRGATFGESTGTVLWKIDPVSLCVDRLGNTDAPSSGTGAAWQAAGSYLLSTSNRIYTYRPALDPAPGSSGAWTQEIPNAPHAINDLGNQWVVPEPIPVFLCFEKDKEGNAEEEKFYTIEQNDADPTQNEVVSFEPTLPGTWGKCEADGNAFVSDPIAGGVGGESKPTDKVWHMGCYEDGPALWRENCDGVREYIFGSDTTPKLAPPAGFLPYPCETVQRVTDTRPFCVLDSDGGAPVKTVYQQEQVLTGEIIWFDENGEIPEPEFKTAGECPPSDEETAVSDTIVCFEGKTYIRRRTDNLADNGTGLLEPVNYSILIFNGDGTLYSSGVTLIADSPTPPEPAYEVGDCVLEFIGTERDTYCEIPAKFLLLIDSGGGFARYSFLTKTWSNVSTLSVASAGGSADVENRILYNFVAPDQITRVDVNTDTQLPNLTVTDGAINPAVATNPKTFSAASFRAADGKLYAQDTGGADAGLYCVNVSPDPAVTTATVDFVTPITGVSGTGTSIMIDNSTDTLIVNGSNLSYTVDWGTGVATLWGNPPIQPNGGTFDTEGNAYVTSSTDTYCLPAGADANDSGAWQQIIDDWTPAANSIAYYEVDAPEPPEFECRYGVQADGTRVPLGTFEVGCGNENSPRTIVGEIVPCSYLEREKLCDQTAVLERIAEKDDTAELCTGERGFKVEAVKHPIQYFTLEGKTPGLRNREWSAVFPSFPASEYTTERGRAIREGFDFTVAPTVDNVTTSMALNDTDNTAGLADVQLKTGSICIPPEQAGLYRYTTNSEGYYAVLLGQCGGPLTVISELGKPVGVNTQPEFVLPVGNHSVELWNIDTGGSNSSWNLQFYNGVAWVNANSLFDTSITPPYWQCRDGWICGTEYQTLTGDPLVFDTATVRCKPDCAPAPCCGSDSGSAALPQTLVRV